MNARRATALFVIALSLILSAISPAIAQAAPQTIDLPSEACAGHTNDEKAACARTLNDARAAYGIEVLVSGINFTPGAEGFSAVDYGLKWSLDRAQSLKRQVEQTAAFFGGARGFTRAFGKLTFVLVSGNVGPGRSHWDPGKKRAHLVNGFWLHADAAIHEMGHAWADLNGLEPAFLTSVGGSYTSAGKYQWNSNLGRPFTPYGETDHREDLAEAFRVVVTSGATLGPSVRHSFIDSHKR